MDTFGVVESIPVRGEPRGIAFDGTNIYIADSADNVVTKLVPR